jgi:two-component system response regulator ChvI
LIVDDEYDILNLIKLWLELDGFNACTFVDPLIALEHFILNSKYYNIVISDIRMPGMNGYEFARKIIEASSQVKIILMSSLEMKEDSELLTILSDVDVAAFIQKPFSLETLRSMIVRVATQR